MAKARADNKCPDAKLLKFSFRILENSGQRLMIGVPKKFKEMVSILPLDKSFHKDLNWQALGLPGIKTYETAVRALVPMLKKAKAGLKISQPDIEKMKSYAAKSIATAEHHLANIKLENAPSKHTEAVERRITNLQSIADIFKDEPNE